MCAWKDRSARGGLLRTATSSVTTSCLSSCTTSSHLSRASERKVNIAVYSEKMLPIPRDGCSTYHMSLYPIATLHSGCSLQRVRQWSYTRSSLVTFYSFLNIYGIKMPWAYSLKVVAALGFNIWTALAITVQVTLGLSVHALWTSWDMREDHFSHPGGDQAHLTVLGALPGSHVEKTQDFHLCSDKQCTTLKRLHILFQRDQSPHSCITKCNFCPVRLDYPLALFIQLGTKHWKL